MTSSTIAFVVAQITILFAAAHFHDGTHWRGCVFYGVLAAQFAIIGVWLGVGDRPLLQRCATGLLFGTILAAVAITRPNFNPWELLLAGIRVIALGVVFGLIRRKKELRIRRTDQHAEVRLLQFSLKHLFVLMFGSAAFLALLRLLESYGGGLYDVLLAVTIVTLGLAAALVSVVASAAALSNSNVATITTTTFVILIVAGGLAWVAYSQTNSLETAAQWFSVCILEAILVTTSLMAFRLSGYQLVRQTMAAA